MTNPYLAQLNSLNNGGQSKSLAPVVPSNPYLNQLAEQGKTTDDSHDDDSGFFHSLGSFLKYLPTVSSAQNQLTDQQGYSKSIGEVYNNVKSDLSNAIDYYKKTPFSQIGQDAMGLGGQVIDTGAKLVGKDPNDNTSMLGAIPKLGGTIGKGLLGMVEKPIEALTYTVNDNGTAKPASVTDEAQSLQATAAIVAQIGSFKLLKGTLLPEQTGEASLNKLAMGKVRNGLNYVAGEGIAGGLSGGVAGAVGGMGKDDQAEQIISSALTFAPLSAAMGMLGVKGYLGDIREQAGKFVKDVNTNSLHDIAAVNSLRVNPADPIDKLIKNTDAISGGDNLVKAAINAKISAGDGYIVEGVSPELASKIATGVVKSSTLERPDESLLSNEIRKPRPRPNGTEVKFDSPLDKLAYLASGSKEPSSFIQNILDDYTTKTGISEEDIINHGKAVRAEQKRAFRADKLVPQNQAEIDAYNLASIEKGKQIVSSLRDGGTVKDANGVVWTRQGNNIIDPVSQQSLPIDQSNTLGILGRTKNDTPFYRPYQQVPAQEWNPDFGRATPPKGTVNYHYADNGTMLVTPIEYKPNVIAFFKKNGFVPGEIASLNGQDYSVIGQGFGDLIKVKNLADGKTSDTFGSNLRRTNHSLTPIVVKYNPIDYIGQIKIVNGFDDELVHGTSNQNANLINQSGKFDPNLGNRHYYYSQFGPDAVYFGRTGSYWTDSNISDPSMMKYETKLKGYVSPSARVAQITSEADFTELAKRAGFDSGKALERALWVDGLKGGEEPIGLNESREAVKKIKALGIDVLDIGNLDQSNISVLNIAPDQVVVLDPSKVSTKPFTEGKLNRIAIKAPVLSPDAIVDKLYDNFKSSYDNAPEETAFSGVLDKFFHDNRIDTKDQSHIASLMTKKLGDDLALQHLSPEEYASRSELMGKFIDLRDDKTLDDAHSLSNFAASNNLLFQPEGAGRYRIRFADSGKTLLVVSSPEAALNVINKMRQSQGLDIDGGYTGVIPTGVANIGGLAGQLSDNTPSKFDRSIDTFRVGGRVGQKISPIFSVIRSIEDLSGGKIQLSEPWLKLQEAQMNRSNLQSRNPSLGKLAKDGQRLLNEGSTISDKRRLVLADNADTMTIDEIKNKYLGSRTSNSFENQAAEELASTKDVAGVTDLLYKAKMISPSANVGGNVFMQNLLELGKDKYDPAVINAASKFSELVGKYDKDMFSGELVLRLASALEDPSKAISRAEHGRLKNITPREQSYVDGIQKWFSDAAPIAGIDPKAKFSIYLPNLIRQIAGAKGELNVNTEFAREMSRVGITPRNMLLRDPNQLLTKYYTSIINHKSGFNDSVKAFQDTYTPTVDAQGNSIGELNKLKGTDMEDLIPALKDKLDAHTREVLGYPNPDDQLAKGMESFAKNIGIRVINSNSLISAISASQLILRPVAAVRDYFTPLLRTYNSFGLELTKEIFNKSLSSKDIQWMKDNNKLGASNHTRSQMMDPAANGGELIPENSRFKRSIDTAFRLTGQEQSYEHINTGVYKGSMSMAAKYFDQLEQGTISKDQAFNKLGISSNYGKGITDAIDNHLKNGRADLAADLYAQTNMRFVSNVYGFNNNPVGWKSGFGRLLSQYGSYSANASVNFLDNISSGTKPQIAGKISRVAISGMALHYAGNSVGLNLNSWITNNPLTVFPGTGPLVNMLGDYGQQVAQGKLTLGHFAVNGLDNFLPYFKAAHNFVDGLDQVGQGQMIKGLWKMGGGSINK